MSIPVVCSNCSARLNAPDSAAGKKVKCPKCQTGLVVPTPQAEEPAFEVVEDEPATKPAAKPKVKTDVVVEDEEDVDEKPRKKRASVDRDDEDEDDRPRKKKKPAAGNPMLVRNIIGGVVLLVLLGVAGWVFYDKLWKKEETAGASSGGNPPTIPTRQPGPPSELVNDSRTAKIQEVMDDMDRLFKLCTNTANKISDDDTAASSSKELQAHMASLLVLNDKLKEVGKLTSAEAKFLRIPTDATAESLAEALKRAARLFSGKKLSPRASEELRKALGKAGEGLAAIEKTMRSIMPDGKTEPNPKGLPPFSAIHSLAVTPDGKRLFACGSVSRPIRQPGNSPIVASLRSWTIDGGSPGTAREYLVAPESFDSSLAVSPDGKTLAVYSRETLTLHKVDTGEVTATATKLPKLGLYTRIAFTADGESVVFAVDKNLVTVRSADGAVMIKRPKDPPVDSGGNAGLKPNYVPGLKRVAQVRETKDKTGFELATWDPASDSPPLLVRLQQPAKVGCFAVSADGKLVAVGSNAHAEENSDTRVTIHSVIDGKRIAQITADPQAWQYDELQLSSDGQLLAAIVHSTDPDPRFCRIDLVRSSDGKRLHRVSVPTEIRAGELASNIVITADSKSVYYIQGGLAVHRIDAKTGAETDR